MAFGDFINKVKRLLQGDPQQDDMDDIYFSRQDDEQADYFPEDYYEERDSAANLARRMADEYSDYDDDEAEYYDNEDYDEAPTRIYDRSGSYDEYEESDPYYDEPKEETMPQPVPQPEEPLPTRTEVTLREIKRLSERLDDEALRRYQMELYKIKKETGAVSALTALRVIHKYVDGDDDTEYSPNENLPDLAAK